MTFVALLLTVLYAHYYQWRQTERMLAKNKRISVHDKKEKMAISLIFSHVFGSQMMADRQALSTEEMEQIQEDENGDEETKEEISPST